MKSKFWLDLVTCYTVGLLSGCSKEDPAEISKAAKSATDAANSASAQPMSSNEGNDRIRKGNLYIEVYNEISSTKRQSQKTTAAMERALGAGGSSKSNRYKYMDTSYLGLFRGWNKSCSRPRACRARSPNSTT